MSNGLEVLELFPSAMYKTSAPEYIDNVRLASLDSIDPSETINKLYPNEMSGDITHDERVFDFASYVIQTSWNILADQGYDMSKKQTVFQAMWMQEHHKMSGMEQHVHSDGVQLVGFYFLDVPENSSTLLLHDPRPGKLSVDLKKGDESKGTFSASVAGVSAKPGDLIFTNSWLPHSFTRHNNDNEPLRFVHINITVRDIPEQACELPTVV
jgi:hypothetical protein